jgi:hypothetical protein
MIYHSRGEHANHYTTDAVDYKIHLSLKIADINIVILIKTNIHFPGHMQYQSILSFWFSCSQRLIFFVFHFLFSLREYLINVMPTKSFISTILLQYSLLHIEHTLEQCYIQVIHDTYQIYLNLLVHCIYL